MFRPLKDYILLVIITLAITFAIWLPYFLALPNFWGLSFKEGFSTIYRNFDGLEYIVIAKTFYNPGAIAAIPQTLSANYYAAHFPGYAILILIFSPLFGFLKSMLFISLLFTMASACAFYFLVSDFKLSSKPLFLSLLFLLLPARWVIVHSVGSAEPVFIFFIIFAIYFFMKYELQRKYKLLVLSAIFGVFAQLTRPPAILLFIAFGIYVLWQGYKKRSVSYILSFFPTLLIPFTLIGIFYLYSQTYGDFWAYFHSGDNIHLTFPPFQVFNKHQFWVGEIWLEDIIYIFMLGFLGGLLLIKQKLYPLAAFVLVYLGASVLITHRDISRYTLPIFPFLLIAFEKVLTSREFKIILPIILLAIYLYAQNFLIANTAPIPNLSIFN